MTRALVPLADGVEEMEAVITIDVFRRAGWDVVSCAIAARTVRASRNVLLTADADWSAVDSSSFDIIALPGGAGGTKALAGHAGLLNALQRHAAQNRLLAAICAAPLVLQAAGLIEHRRITSHPSVKDQLRNVTWLNERVVVDGRIVTSQGPGTTFEFALELVAQVQGPDAAAKLAAGMIL